MKGTMQGEPNIPTAFQCCLLVRRLVESWNEDRKTKATRFRISELTLKRVCCRPRLDAAFLLELQDYLLRAGWALFYAGRSYALIKLDSVEAWPRPGSKRIRTDLESVVKGEFDFSRLISLFEPAEQSDED